MEKSMLGFTLIGNGNIYCAGLVLILVTPHGATSFLKAILTSPHTYQGGN